MNLDDVVAAWDRAAPNAIHPSRGISETVYRESGAAQARQLAAVFKPESRVVDYGCGDGRVAAPLAALGFDVVGVDSSPNMLRRLADTAPEVTPVQSSGADLAASIGRKADAAYCLAVLIHHSYADCLSIVEQLAAAVRKGGLIVLDWPLADRPRERSHWIDVTTWGLQEREHAARGIGLQSIESPLPWATYRVR